jgi:hypothetical protein
MIPAMNPTPENVAPVPVGSDALVSDSDERPNVAVWKSYVWHKDRCFFVSTIERTYDAYAGSMRGHETLVWAHDWKKAERGEMLHQAGGVNDHQQICRCLIAEGLFPDEDDDRTKRFCR